MLRRLAVLAVTATAAVGALPAYAQDDAAPARAQDDARRDAAAHFAKGEAAFARGDYLVAAAEFDRAYETLPHYDPLWNAAEAWEHAGEPAKAANRYAAFLREAPPEAKDRNRATAALARLGPRLARLRVVGSKPGTRVDDEPLAAADDWVYPGVHVVEGSGPNGPEKRTVTVHAGEILSVSFDAEEPSPAPAAPPAAESVPAPTASKPPAPAPAFVWQPPAADAEAPRRKGWPPWVVVVEGGLTVVALGIATASGISTLNAKASYDEHPTSEGLVDGRASEVRTNVLFGVAGGLAVLTGVSALFVDWRGHGARASSR